MTNLETEQNIYSLKCATFCSTVPYTCILSLHPSGEAPVTPVIYC